MRHLDGHSPAQLFVVSLVNNTEAAGPEARRDLVPAEATGNEKIVGAGLPRFGNRQMCRISGWRYRRRLFTAEVFRHHLALWIVGASRLSA
jgi:hypothetical protein